MPESLTSAAGWVAIGGAVAAALALVLAIGFYLQLRNVRQVTQRRLHAIEIRSNTDMIDTDKLHNMIDVID